MNTTSIPPQTPAVNQTAATQTLLVAYTGLARCTSALNGPITSATDDEIKARALRELEQRGVDPYQPYEPTRGRDGNHADESIYHPGDKAFAGRNTLEAEAREREADQVLGLTEDLGDPFEEAA